MDSSLSVAPRGSQSGMGHAIRCELESKGWRVLTAEGEVRVKKRVKRHGRLEELGELAIQFGSLDELNGLIEKLRR